MLRLRQALADCNLPQKRLVDSTGWSKAQVSITLSTGRLPVDAERFRADVRRFVECEPQLLDWLKQQELWIDSLFDAIGPAPVGDFDQSLITFTGRIATAGPRTDDLFTLARATHFLLAELRCHVSGDDLAIAEGRASQLLRTCSP